MSETAPKGPYIYQPYGQQDEANWKAERLWAVSGVVPFDAYNASGLKVLIKGLTRREADLVLAAIKRAAKPPANFQAPPRAGTVAADFLAFLQGASCLDDLDKIEREELRDLLGQVERLQPVPEDEDETIPLEPTPCKGCGKLIHFAKTVDGKTVPLDPRPPVYAWTPDGWKRANGKNRPIKALVTHFATCARANDFSGKPPPKYPLEDSPLGGA